MSWHPTRTLQATAALLLLLGGCVKKSEYDTLQIENQTLQKRVDQTNHLLVQSQTDLSALHIQMQQFAVVQAQLQKTQLELKQSQDDFKALKTKFEQFRAQRRSAMVGKKLPMLSLDEGKVLHDVEITAVSGEDISLRHSGGALKVALAKTSDDLRWEACYDPLEASNRAREKMLLETQALDSRLARERGNSAPVPAPLAAKPRFNAVDVLRSQLAAQRGTLNAEYQALAAKNGSALRGVVWDSAQPEASPLLNSISGSRAVLGISRLQSQRDAILATLKQLRELDPAAR